jgi:hypothetical protein
MDWLRAQPIHFELSEPNLKILNVRNLTDTTNPNRKGSVPLTS